MQRGILELHSEAHGLASTLCFCISRKLSEGPNKLSQAVTVEGTETHSSYFGGKGMFWIWNLKATEEESSRA